MKKDLKINGQTTIMEVALAAGVSLATVSRVTNHPEKVKPETREKIERIIKEKGYKPNLNAKSLASSRSTTIAVVVPELTRSSIAGLVDGIAACAAKRGYLVRLFVNNPKYNEQSVEEFWGTVMSSVVDGIIYINDEITPDRVKFIENSYIPIVLANTVCSNEDIPYVSIDYQKAGYELTKQLIEKGNKNIWLVSSTRKYVVNDLKVAGYTQAMEEAGLTPVVKNVPGDPELNEPIFEDLLRKECPDVAIVVRDSMAVSLLNSARLIHLHVPDDLQIVGFQNTKYAELARPRLTCIDTPIFDLGEAAMDLLTDLIREYNSEEEEEQEINTKVFIPFSIKWRGSTK